MANEILLTEGNKSESPTSLNLFRFNRQQLEGAKDQYQVFDQFKREFTTAQRAFLRLSEDIKKRWKGLEQVADELTDQYVSIRSSKTCGAVYLKMHEELSGRGVADDEIFEFFATCLKINTLDSERYLDADGTGSYGGRLLAIMEGKRVNYFANLVNEHSGEPPVWFGKSKNDWRGFVASHAWFFSYLNPDHVGRLLRGSLSRDERENLLGTTRSDGFADWFTEKNGLPSRAEIEEEMAGDTKELEDNRLRYQQDLRQRKIFLQLYDQKFKKVAIRFEERRRELPGSISNFATLLMFLDVTKDVIVYEADLQKVASDATSKQLLASEVSARAAREKMIETFCERARKELVALFIERKLREGKIIDNVQESIDKSSNLYQWMLDEIIQIRPNLQFQALKGTNRRAFSVLNYEIKPILEVLSSGELEYLQDLLKEYSSYPLEMAIWEMAEVIALHLDRTESGGFLQQGQVAIGHLKEFSKRFLKNHWQWVYQQLQASLLSGPWEKVLPVKELEVEEPGVPIEVHELETEFREINRDNLHDWQLYYTKSRNLDPGSLVEISGETIDEREEKLGQFIGINNIACSVGPGSVIRALDWVVTIPEEVEQWRGNKQIGETVFGKIKRGPVRIFYVVDQAKREIIFFVHQKKAYTYGF